MTANEFLVVCLEYYIDPAIALENDNIRQALRDKDNNAIRNILENEF